MAIPCPPEDWPRFSELLDHGLALDHAERETWLAALAGDDARLCPFLARVLMGTGHAETASFLREPVMAAEDFVAGDRIGPYQLVARIGAGGMGEVWRAARADDGPRREVALKLPHPEFLGAAYKRRFARERDVLAALSHPNIAQLYEAGANAEGHPYLALELIEGVPVSSYCKAQTSTLAQRVDLLRQVLAGLGYAHQRLIVHRDIKPGNVLVTPEGQVKLLDFGIAKLLGPDDGGDALLTRMGRAATPAYAPPEQLSGGAITVAADIYSAGALLFELCTGARPFADAPTAEGAPLASSRADADTAGITEPQDLQRGLRGDLDAIIACALSPDPASRYLSATAFDDDLERWQRGLPVRARRIGWLTRSQKFIRRNRLAVSMGGVLALVLAGGTAGIVWQAHRAEGEAHRAEAQAARATAIKDFMIALFAAGDPHGGAKHPDEMTARELLDRGADRAEKAFANDVPAKIELFATLGQIYDNFDSDRAMKLWSRRLELTRQLYGDDDPAVLHDSLDLVESLTQSADYEAARAALEPIKPKIIKRFGTASLEWARWLSERTDAIRNLHGARDEIDTNLAGAIAIFASHPLDKGDSSSISAYLSSLYLRELQQTEAEQFEAGLATLREMRSTVMRFTPDDPLDRLDYLYTVATVIEHQGKLDAAEGIYDTIERQSAHLVGRNSQIYQLALLNRGMLAGLRGDRDRAQALFGTTKTDHGSARRIYAAYLVAIGRGAEAVAPLQAALAAIRQHAQDEDTERHIEATLGEALAQAGRTAEARDMLRSARDAFLRWGVPGTAATLSAQERWANFLLSQHETAAAIAEFRAVLAQSRGKPSAPAARAAAGLAQAARAAGDMRSADANSATAVQMLEATTQEYDARARIDVWLVRAEILQALGRTAAAHTLAERAAGAAETEDAPGSAQVARARDVLKQD
jgi:serine/threonine protein kinase